MQIVKYPDGSSYAKITNDFNLNFTFRINSYEDLWHLNQIIDIYDSRDLWPTVTIPWLIDGQADKRFNDDESSGLKLVCNFLNNTPANFKIFHPHNSEVVEALMDNVKIIDNSEFIKEVIWKINGNYSKESLYLNLKKETLILMSSDAGGFKPLMKLCDKIGWKGQTISAVKHRYWNPITEKSELTQLLTVKDLEGKDILIIDDICVYGGTFKGLSKLLKSRNCGKLYLAVSHLTIQYHPQNNVFEYFDRVFTTNSRFNEYFSENEYRESLPPSNLTTINLF